MRKVLFAAPMLLLGAAFLSPAPVLAQGATQATVVSSCGTPPNTYVAGTTRNITQDTTGTTCTSAGGGAGGNVNLTGINGVTPSVGAGATGTGSLRTTQAQDTTTVAGAAPTTTGIYVTGPSAAALSTAANQTNVQGAPAATYPTTVLGVGCRAATTAPTAVTDGQTVAPMCGTNGQQAVVIGSVAALKVRGHASSTDTAAHTLIAAGAAGIKNYITGIQCSRNDAGTSPITLTFSDDQSSTMLLPNAGNGGGNNFILTASPLATAAATAFTFTSGTGTTTVVCNAQGYTGP